jgi:hypothetical protein
LWTDKNRAKYDRDHYHEALALQTLHLKGTLAGAIDHLSNFRFHGLEYAKAKNWLEEQARNSILQSGPPKLEPNSVTQKQFDKLAAKGKIHEAATANEDLARILDKRVPAVDFDITQGHPFSDQYESGILPEQLRQEGLFVDDDHMGMLLVGTTPENLTALKNARTALEYGRAYGYSDADVAAFYLERRGNNAELAHAEFDRDFKCVGETEKS